MLVGLFFVLLLANSANSQTSPFAGKYQGTFALRVPIIVAEPVDDGTWDITITSDGDITGSHFSKTTGNKTSFKGSIDEKGQITIFFGDEGIIIKGLLNKTEKYLFNKTEKYLSGSLGVPCDFGRKKKICTEIDVRLRELKVLMIG